MRPTGPIPADIMIVGEAPGEQEEKAGEPFVGASGQLLTSMLHAVGITRSSCFITNVCRHRPPFNPVKKVPNDITMWMSDNVKNPHPEEGWVRLQDQWVHPHVKEGYDLLYKELAMVQPRLCIALGNTSTWALTGHWGVSKWRGSRLTPTHIAPTVVPAFHPAAILRQLELHPILKMDLQRAKNIYEGKQLPRHYSFVTAPSFPTAYSYLSGLVRAAVEAVGDFLLVGDIETRAGMITCIGFATDPDSAICIPFLTASPVSPFYWTIEEEARLVHLIQRLFHHPKILHIGQNYLYDCQYFGRHWISRPTRVFDTMVGHHSLYSSLRKGLDFLSSMYAQDHVYWKDESKNWDPKVGERQLWTYNCKDAAITYEVYGAIQSARKEMGLGAHFEFQQSLFFPVLRMMDRGIRISHTIRNQLRKDLTVRRFEQENTINYMVGHPLNPNSPKKVMQFFYEDLGLPGIKSLKNDKLTSESEALEIIATREPLLRPLCVAISEARTVKSLLSTFIEAELDVDGRMRSSFNIAGTISYRFSSSENAFGSGLNFENIPTDETGKRKVKPVPGQQLMSIPNVRTMFIPDEGYEFFDLDLNRADLYVVVWEADDDDLRRAMALDLDLHLVNACDLFEIKGIPYEELQENHPNYKDHRKKIGNLKRQQAKQGVHAVDYGVGVYKLAITLGITRHEADRFIRRWLGAHPGIETWHRRTEAALKKFGFIENCFGARLYQMGRMDLPEALGWLPQSVVSGVINRILVAVDASEQAGETKIQLLNQVHDSLAGQYPLHLRQESEAALLRAAASVVAPYEKPLHIPVGLKTSTISWGDCE